MSIIEKKNARDCIRVLRTIFRTQNEKQTQFSALKELYKIVKEKRVPKNISKGFLCEFIFLFRGLNVRSELYAEKVTPLYLKLSGNEAALERTIFLDEYASNMELYFKRYRTGLEADLIRERNELKKDILDFFDANENDWNDYFWHLKHIISDSKTLRDLIKLDSNEIKGLELAEEHNISFQITPYYLSLFDKENQKQYDHSIRAQVLPSENYCKNFLKSRESGESMDFMEEASTSPIESITRRYPKILILKPFNSCPQICIYCQRNWELKSLDESKTTKNSVFKAIEWINNNPHITEVLVTGGDPFTLGDSYLDGLLGRISQIDHVERIRIGTRTLVTLPSRITDSLIDILSKYNSLGKREICIMTHFQHPTEINPDTLEVVSKIKKHGINIYNQQVFTYYNSKKFETCLLRKTMKKSGIDPYYTFNTKGKEETIDYRVPISRIEQERHEEARLLPGLERTDEPVFNVPRLGKSHLRAWQDHEVIMIQPNGRRIYRFYPWESKLKLVESYNYVDVSIYDYLERLHRDGEDIDEFSSIWYYF
ncbi:MAG: KamA family radical SAM protein [Nitrospirae bacterium]|nr:KamA family radical SAM protein [Nitrospirota bacterium]